MQKACEFCQEPFEARRAAARFCGDTCKKRAQRAGAPVVALAPAPLADTQPSEAPLVSTTRATLTKAGVLDSVSGQLALILAAQVAAGRDTLSGLSSGAKQLEASVAAALASVTRADQMDEVTRRRDEKLRAAGAS